MCQVRSKIKDDEQNTQQAAANCTQLQRIVCVGSMCVDSTLRMKEEFQTEEKGSQKSPVNSIDGLESGMVLMMTINV